MCQLLTVTAVEASLNRPPAKLLWTLYWQSTEPDVVDDKLSVWVKVEEVTSIVVETEVQVPEPVGNNPLTSSVGEFLI